MTQKDLERLIDRNSQIKTVTTETGIEAGLKLAEIADKADIQWAFAGGIAMHIYGYVRATTDVDIIAGGLVGLESEKKSSFGGESYLVKVADSIITVNWIVRDDEYEGFYLSALAEAIEIKAGLKIISPEWLVILKHLAGGLKDQLDLIWLLHESNLVNREQVFENVKRVLGGHAVFLINALQREFDYADVLRMRGKRNKYESSFKKVC